MSAVVGKLRTKGCDEVTSMIAKTSFAWLVGRVVFCMSFHTRTPKENIVSVSFLKLRQVFTDERNANRYWLSENLFEI